MVTNTTIEDTLREAIQGEIESYELYTSAVKMVQTAHVQDMLVELAGEELKHRRALEKMLANPGSIRRGVRQIEQAPIQDYKIGDHLVVKPLGPESTFQDVCIFASRKEQQAHELYRDLAEQSEGETRDLLSAISKDELRHKNLVESWYEEVVYKDF